MKQLKAITGLIWISFFSAGGQVLSDSVVHIRQVQILARPAFVKEEAGMRSSRTDTLVLASKSGQSLAELLSENTPVFIKNHGRGALSTASFRGSAPSHTQVSWNGMNINSPMTGMVDFSLIPVYLMDDISLRHGAASLADRSGGIGGSVNLANRFSWHKGLEFRYRQAFGSYGTFDEFLQAGGGNSVFQARTRIYHNRSRNNYPFTNRAIAQINPANGQKTYPEDTNSHAGYLKYGILQEIAYRPHPNHSLTIRYWGQRGDRSIPRATSYEGPDKANLSRQIDKDHKVVADWKYTSHKQKLILRSGYTHKQLLFTFVNHIQGSGSHTDIFSTGTQQSFHNSLSWWGAIGPNQSSDAGLVSAVHQVITHDSVSNRGYAKQRHEISAYFSWQVTLLKRVNLKALFRQDWVNGKNLPILPYIGLDFRPSASQGLIIKTSIARNHNNPSLNDLYWQPGGNPGLLPEEGISYEAGMQFFTSPGRFQVNAEITAFRSDIKNWIVWLPSFKGYWEPMNISRVLSNGLESAIQLTGRVGPVDLRLNCTYAFTRSLNLGNRSEWGDESHGRQLVFIPIHSGNVFVHASYKGFYLNFQHNSYSERFTTSNNDLTQRNRLYPYFMNDISAGKDFRLKRMAILTELKTMNLFNEKYHSVLYQPMPGRHYLVTILIRFVHENN